MKTNDELVAEMKAQIKQHGDQKALAERLGISVGFLNDILRGRAPVTKDVAEKLGYRKAVVFIKDKK